MGLKVTNKKIKKIVEKMTITYKYWHAKSPLALDAYGTSIRTSRCATPYFLVYGMEVVLSVGVEYFVLTYFDRSENRRSQIVQARYSQLNFIEEKRSTALCHGQCYERRVAPAYYKKVKPRNFKEVIWYCKRLYRLRMTHMWSSDSIMRVIILLLMCYHDAFKLD